MGKFFFDATQARPIQKEILLNPSDLLLKGANEGQKAAVEAVLAAEDLVLLQGPPGTGKTTVITEICYQMALRGRKVLIASQANLAVDNALERLPHHPLLRPLREGIFGNDDVEKYPYSESNVVHRWREDTARDCENQLIPKIKLVQGLVPLLTQPNRFKTYVEFEINYPTQKSKLEEYLEHLAVVYESKKATYELQEAERQEVEKLLEGLNNIVKSNAILQINQKHKLDELINQLEYINLAKEQLQQWYFTANPHIYKILKQCLLQRQYLTDNLIILPSPMLTILNENLPNWFEYINDAQREFNTLIDSFKQCDRVCEIANRINWLISKNRDTLAQLAINNNHVNLLVEQLQNRISSQDYLSAIDWLYKIIQKDIEIINSLENDQEKLKSGLRLSAIQVQAQSIIQQSQPPL
ncbi:MAG TPA: AAA domain-containing protein, partial [Nostocaceae cyanobacterium]|nr:AAA domain-containing protein [Nostocaceae cyanobacterium]